MFNGNEARLASLNRHLGFLEALERSHLTWAGDTTNVEARRKHVEIAATFRWSLEQYVSLLETYNQTDNHPTE